MLFCIFSLQNLLAGGIYFVVFRVNEFAHRAKFYALVLHCGKNERQRFHYVIAVVVAQNNIAALRLLHALGNAQSRKPLPVQTVHAPLNGEQSQVFRNGDKLVVVIAERRTEQPYGLPGDVGYFLTTCFQFRTAFFLRKFAHLRMSLAVRSDFEPARSNFRNLFRVFVHPKSHQKERGFYAPLLANVHNLACFVRAPSGVETDCGNFFVRLYAINWQLAAACKHLGIRTDSAHGCYANESDESCANGFFHKNSFCFAALLADCTTIINRLRGRKTVYFGKCGLIVSKIACKTQLLAYFMKNFAIKFGKTG